MTVVLLVMTAVLLTILIVLKIILIATLARREQKLEVFVKNIDSRFKRHSDAIKELENESS